jgi:hypothetical protein
MGAEMKTVGYIILIEAKATQDKTSETMSYGYPNETDSEMLLRRGRATLFESYEEAEQALKETLLAATAQNSKWPEKFIYKIVPVEITAPQPKPEQKPVAWMREDEDCTDCIVWEQTEEHTIPLYITPPQRKPLTRQQIREIEINVSLNISYDYITPAEQLCRAIEAAHGIKSAVK